MDTCVASKYMFSLNMLYLYFINWQKWKYFFFCFHNLESSKLFDWENYKINTLDQYQII
jgi:hypothetical protein